MGKVEIRFRISLVVFLVVILFSTLIFSVVEGVPIADSLYYSIVTVSTVGYGDIHPMTNMGKITSVFLIVTGVGTFLGVVGNLSEMMIKRHERNNRSRKIYILSGLFFSEMGNKLLPFLANNDKTLERTAEFTLIDETWSEKVYADRLKRLEKFNPDINVKTCDLKRLYEMIRGNKELLMQFLENPALTEDESFTSLIRLIFHLYEEFTYRFQIGALDTTDYEHLEEDIVKLYKALIHEYLLYIENLQDHFPGLFRFAITQSPFSNPIDRKN
ncbi:two pore domain potassium channel family protein [Puteibacter caeruleilacunae]|nr:two pore domain potassium channel family protein [Puteibacter caeruleilacunae]